MQSRGQPVQVPSNDTGMSLCKWNYVEEGRAHRKFSMELTELM